MRRTDLFDSIMFLSFRTKFFGKLTSSSHSNHKLLKLYLVETCARQRRSTASDKMPLDGENISVALSFGFVFFRFLILFCLVIRSFGRNEIVLPLGNIFVCLVRSVGLLTVAVTCFMSCFHLIKICLSDVLSSVYICETRVPSIRASP